MIIVGAPGAETAYLGANQESYWRTINGYSAWADSLRNREEVIYVGANDGMLHAFNADTGKELWGFIPPFIGSNLPTMVNVNFNRASNLGGGGTNPIYGVDGLVTAHDMYFINQVHHQKWYTILMVPYGKGGAGFSLLDVTNPNNRSLVLCL